MREGVFLFLIGLLIFVTTGSELRLGLFVLLQSALSFISFFLVGRFVRPKSRVKVLGVGAIAMAGAALLFLMPITASVMILYGCVIAVVIPLFLVPLQGLVFEGASLLSSESGSTDEHIITREVFENAGRVVGIGAFLLLLRMYPKTQFVPTFAIGLGFVQLITWICVRSTPREAEDFNAGDSVPPVIKFRAHRVWAIQNGEANRPLRGLKSLFRRTRG